MAENITDSLFRCIAEGEIERVKSILGNKLYRYNINSRSPVEKRTALHEAVSHGQHEIVRYLLEKKADVNAPDVDGSTPLYEAAHINDLAMIKLLLDYGADSNCKNNEQFSAFHHVLFTGDEDSANLFMSYGVDVNRKHYNDETALHVAVVHCSLEFVEKLLKVFKVKANQVTKENETPLHWLLRYHQPHESVLDKVKLLVNHGVDVNAVDAVKRTPFYNAVSSKQFVEVLDYLVRSGANVNGYEKSIPLAVAICNNDLELVEYLVRHKAKLDFSFDEQGRGALHLAIEYFNDEELRLQAVELLLRKGASVDQSRGLGATPLQAAIQRQDMRLIKCLLEHGAAFDRRYSSQESTLYTAVKHSFYEAVKTLLKQGALDYEDSYGRKRLIMMANSTQNEKIVAVLRKYGLGDGGEKI